MTALSDTGEMILCIAVEGIRAKAGVNVTVASGETRISVYPTSVEADAPAAPLPPADRSDQP